MTYKAPVRDLIFALNEAADFSRLEAAYPGADADTIAAVLDAAGSFSADVLAPLNRPGDIAGAKFENGQVRAAPGFADAYKQFAEGGWNSLAAEAEHGGQGLPKALEIAVFEMVQSANMAFGLCPMLTQGAIAALATHGTARLPSPAPVARRFHDLAESIAYQQLNGTAAATIWGRVRAATGEDVVTPGGILSRSVDELRACGLSGSKTRSMLDLAERVAAGEISLDRIGRFDDEQVVDALTPVWGIGRWTAQMFLMFTLGRLDVWPTGDYGVRAGYARAWGLDAHPTERELAELGAPFTGARSLVAWYCWRAADSNESGRS